MRIATRRFRPSSGLLVGLVALAALALSACEGGGGTHSLDDVAYWRGQFSRGQGVGSVVAKGRSAVPLLTRLLGDTNEFVVQTAAMAAQQIGEPALATMPALLAALERFPGQPFVVQAIKAMGGAAVPYIVPLVQSSDRTKQTVGVDLLNGIGHDAEPALDALMAIVEDESASTDLRRMTLVTIGSIGTPAGGMIERLTAFKESHADLRRDAAMAIKRIATEVKVIKKGGDR